MRLSVHVIVGALFVFLINASMVCADGKVFKRLAEDPSAATMPDQQALIHFKDGVETLAIETRFTGSAENFAWVVPLPAAPEVSPATRGLFTTLRAMHQPEIKGNYQSLVLLWIPIMIFLLVMIARPPGAWRALCGGVIIVLGILLFLPSLGNARGINADTTDGVTEVSRQLVGEFDVTVIESKEPDALVKWLEERGFGVPAAAEKVIADYVAEGWVFAAAKMRRDAAKKVDGPITPHPLVFKFPVKAPVYPMRLTGVENGGPLKVDLYVLAESRAEAPGFSVERCGKLSYSSGYGDMHSRVGRTKPDVRISHSWLMKNATGAAVATKLSGTVPPEAMIRDVSVSLVPTVETRRLLWSSEAAMDRAVNVGMGVCCVALLCVMVVTYAKKWGPGLRVRPLLVVAALGLVAGGATFAATERAGATRSVRGFRMDDLYMDLCDGYEARQENGPPLDETWLREITKVIVQSEAFRQDGTDKGMAVEEDSPGNYVIRFEDGEWQFVWYDYFGNEHVNPLSNSR
jgi:hypothetical protein